jgi:hypothetical protein
VTFGFDTWCRDELRPGRLATGLELVAQNQYHRLITVRGTLRGGEDEQNYGLGLQDLIGATSFDPDTLPGRIRAELLKDERVDDVAVSVVESTEGPATVYVIDITGTTGEGPFALQVSASEISIELLGLEAG